ncbi:hypothetical protein EV361DRAFT_854574, partial [Lentinula raphanica]
MPESSQRTFDNLNGVNYSVWYPEMSAYLMVKGCWEHVDPDPETVALNTIKEPKPSIESKPTKAEAIEMSAWRKEKNQAVGLLFLCIDESQKTHKKPGNRFSALDALFSIRKEDDESLVSLCGRVSKAIQHIRELRPEKFTAEQIEAELEAMTLIRALPAEYSSFVSSLLLLDTIDVEKLRAAFYNEDAQANIASRSALAAVLAANAATSFPPSRTDPTTTAPKQCGWCERNGHTEDECFTKKVARRRAKERRYGKSGKRGNIAISQPESEEHATQASTNPS